VEYLSSYPKGIEKIISGVMAMVHRLDIANCFLFTVLLCAAPAVAGPQVECLTVENIEAMNKGGIRHLFELRGADSKVFLALDPRFRLYEEHYHALVQQDIDAIVAWKLKGPGGGMAVAVPFVHGCAADGYGQPDSREKVELMRDAAVMIGKFGLDDNRVLKQIKKLAAFELTADGAVSVTPEELEKGVAQIIERVRGLRESDFGPQSEGATS